MNAPSAFAVVVPIKSFASAKARLADVLAPQTRHNVARYCAEMVLSAAGSLPVFVVCEDPAVAVWALAHGARVVNPPSTGLNEAAAAGRLAAREAGFTRVVVVHSDVPHARDLTSLFEQSCAVVIVPDRHGDGTNALLVPTDGPYQFCYGAGSARAHQREALTNGLTHCMLTRPDLALDIDTLDDLHAAGLDIDALASQTFPGETQLHHLP